MPLNQPNQSKRNFSKFLFAAVLSRLNIRHISNVPVHVDVEAII